MASWESDSSECDTFVLRSILRFCIVSSELKMKSPMFITRMVITGIAAIAHTQKNERPPLVTVPVERGGRREHDQFPDGGDYQPERDQADNTPEQSECLCTAGLWNKVTEPDGENCGYRKIQGFAVRHVQQRREHASPPHHPGHKEHGLQDERVLHAVNVEHRRVLLQQHAEYVETEQHKVGKMQQHCEHRKPEPVRIGIPHIMLVAKKFHMVDGYQEHEHDAGHKPACDGDYLGVVHQLSSAPAGLPVALSSFQLQITAATESRFDSGPRQPQISGKYDESTNQTTNVGCPGRTSRFATFQSALLRRLS
ncbi:hypothetical protein OGATHE_000669 [Ogataea polymorpha]|uniref:Uncharacterized protein n=1 Tax=Ogataea polymorpha TaxID=460523 RepID=A0A9P8PVG8_9ASCO|nr:hypothetical protein OGATHE_000669 [Ogataea polymorpha]